MKSGKYFFVHLFRTLLMALLLAAVNQPEAYASGETGKKVKWVKSKTGLASLITLSKDRDQMVAEYKKETVSYTAVKNALDNGHLTRGMSGKEVIDKYGEAVVTLPEGDSGMTRWVYKPAEADHLSGSKIYLFFDKENDLDRWEAARGGGISLKNFFSRNR